jgi:hypothetical protein
MQKGASRRFQGNVEECAHGLLAAQENDRRGCRAQEEHPRLAVARSRLPNFEHPKRRASVQGSKRTKPRISEADSSSGSDRAVELEETLLETLTQFVAARLWTRPVVREFSGQMNMIVQTSRCFHKSMFISLQPNRDVATVGRARRARLIASHSGLRQRRIKLMWPCRPSTGHMGVTCSSKVYPTRHLESSCLSCRLTGLRNHTIRPEGV